MRAKVGNYYDEKARAVRKADHIINENLYVMEKEIDLVKLEIDIAPEFKCNFMKIFYQRLELFQKRDRYIKIEEEVKVYYKEE